MMYIRKTGYVTRQNTEGQPFFGGYTSYKEPENEPHIVWKTGYVLSRAEEEKSRRISKSAELAVVKTQTINEIRQANSPYYAIVSKNGACNVCSSQHGIAYPVSSAIVGENFPPFHPNCKCDVRVYNLEDTIDLLFSNANDNPGGLSPNDWKYFGINGDEFNMFLKMLYTDEYFGKIIKTGDYNQSDLEMHIVDRIARVLFHETSDPDGQAAIAWLILNRMLKEGAQYTTNWDDDLTIYNVVTALEQFEVFQEQHNQNPNQPNPYNPLDWIDEIENSEVKKEQEDSWENSLLLAKLLVSAAGGTNIDDSDADSIRDAFESWVPNPFDCDRPYDVWEYLAEGSVSTDKEWMDTIGGNTFFIR